MDVEVDHYAVLGLPTGEDGAGLSEQEINKAYRLKARELHPDKRPDDPTAHTDFQKLQTSFEVLKDGKTRKLFDDLLRVKREKIHHQGRQDSKRRKMMSDLEDRERSADHILKTQKEEEWISKKLREEIARIRAMHMAAAAMVFKEDQAAKGKVSSNEDAVKVLDKERVLKISWEKIGEDFTAERLRKIFEKFGGVEDVVMKSSKGKGLALVLMASKDVALIATRTMLSDISSPLLVLPLQPASVASISNPDRYESGSPTLRNLAGAGYQAYEDSVLDKLMNEGAQMPK